MTLAPRRGPTAPILYSVGAAVVFVLAAWPAIATIFLFDSGTDLELWAWLLFYGMWGFELLCLLVIPGVWIAWGTTRDKTWGGKLTACVALSPLLAVIPIIVAVFVGW